MKRTLILALVAVLGFATSWAQEYFNLTAEEVRIGERLPIFNHSIPIGLDFSSASYEVELQYPQFIDMTREEVARLKTMMADSLPELPVVNKNLSVERKAGTIDVWLLPFVYRDGKYQKMVSFGLGLVRKPLARSAARADGVEARYAANSVLKDGRWVKIRVADSGVHQITSDLVRKAGFSSLDKVKVYGYGGALQPEKLTGDYLIATDDLKEVPTCSAGGRKLFRAQGPVSWTATGGRLRNTYSNYGYYFLTESEGEPLTVDSATFVKSLYASPDITAEQATYALYEVDDYAWFHGGRNLYDSKTFGTGESREYTLNLRSDNGKGTITIALTSEGANTATVTVNDTSYNMSISAPGQYDAAMISTKTFKVNSIVNGDNKVTIRQNGSSTMRLDYIAMSSTAVIAPPNLSTDKFPVAEYVYGITNQNHHADPIVDMVIIIPTTQKQRAYAEQLAEFHRTNDNMTVNIVPADELYNEFSSGTPDATAYRRFMKMLYDRAQSDADAPRYLLLMGDCAWDNRMISSAWKSYSPDDYLLCYESENSGSDISCYVMEDYFGLLDDGEGAKPLREKTDLGIGRFPVTTQAEAKVMVDKCITFMSRSNAGAWKNLVYVLGDDGDENTHMDGADQVAEQIRMTNPGAEVHKVHWDAYQRVSTIKGNTYPEVNSLIRRQMTDGALVMNYTGHGATYTLSHEFVLQTEDFSSSRSQNLPLWVTAACDVMPFDGQITNIGETAVLNPQGGALAFYGTTRTVFASQNLLMNKYFMKHLFANDAQGNPVRVGDAIRLAKANIVSGENDNGLYLENKVHYALLGNPALAITLPANRVVLDSIGGQDLSSGADINLRAGQRVRLAGHVQDFQNHPITDFQGILSSRLFDSEVTVACHNNAGASRAFTYQDRTSVLYESLDSVSQGRFSFEFVVPVDISYSNASGRLVFYAWEDNAGREANGYSEQFTLGGVDDGLDADTLGPQVMAWLNTEDFQDGDVVNATPCFMAQIEDQSGVNVSGAGVGHNLSLVVDGRADYTYDLNDYYVREFGDFTRGSVAFTIPALDDGPHSVTFHAWDILNNMSTTTLAFQVNSSFRPEMLSLSASQNPAVSSTNFLVSYNLPGSECTFVLDVYDFSGHLMWSTTQTGSSPNGLYSIPWNLVSGSGGRLSTGVYFYRCRLQSGGSSYVSKTQKIIVINNK